MVQNNKNIDTPIPEVKTPIFAPAKIKKKRELKVKKFIQTPKKDFYEELEESSIFIIFC